LREERFHEKAVAASDDVRTPFQHDRDRLIYSSALRRLSGVTQVVSPGTGHVFHNRLTHSLQVAQVGRRLAERLLRLFPTESQAVGGIDPDVVEAACLAHDLGHPPFGHTAEEKLNELARDFGGFEGNAQSFRIVTELAFRDLHYSGLDLTRATLAALLKYPWLRFGNPKKLKKWGAYEEERKQFEFALELLPNKATKTVEAHLMDLADDITYSVHDLEDFYRAGRIPLHLLAQGDDRERKFFFESVRRRRHDDLAFAGRWSNLETAFTELVTAVGFWTREAYTGTREQRAALRRFSGQMIDRFIRSIRLVSRGGVARVEVEQDQQDEIAMFKELTWTYVIEAPGLAAQQCGQRVIIEELYKVFESAALGKTSNKIFPAFFRDRLQEASVESELKRTCIDLIAGLTEIQAVAIHQRLTGLVIGNSLDELLH
jgi:dGTPase